MWAGQGWDNRSRVGLDMRRACMRSAGAGDMAWPGLCLVDHEKEQPLGMPGSGQYLHLEGGQLETGVL